MYQFARPPACLRAITGLSGQHWLSLVCAKGAFPDNCKSDVSDFTGSNPVLATMTAISALLELATSIAVTAGDVAAKRRAQGAGR